MTNQYARETRDAYYGSSRFHTAVSTHTAQSPPHILLLWWTHRVVVVFTRSHRPCERWQVRLRAFATSIFFIGNIEREHDAMGLNLPFSTWDFTLLVGPHTTLQNTYIGGINNFNYIIYNTIFDFIESL